MTPILRRILLAVIAIALFIFANFRAQERAKRKPEPIPPLKWGFIDKTGKLVIPTTFDDIGQSGDQIFGAKRFAEGLCAAKLGNEWGYIDRSGRWQIEPRFNIARAFHEGLAYVCNDTTYGYIDPQGNMKIKLETDPIKDEAGITGALSPDFCCGRAMIRVKELKGKEESYGYIDKSGKIIIQPQYAYADQFSEGLAAVQSQTDKRWGYINPDGQYVIAPTYARVSTFHDGLAVVDPGPLRNKHDVYVSHAVIDKSGKWVFDCAGRMFSTSSFSEGLLPVEIYSWWWKSFFPGVHSLNSSGVADRRGNILFESQFTPSNYSDGLAVEYAKGHLGFVDKNGRWIIKPQFDNASYFSEGRAAVGKNGKGGYIDKTGRYVIEPVYYSHSKRVDMCPQPFAAGLAAVPVLKTD